MTAPTRPVLRYHGGKWRLAPWILSFFPAAHRTYVEPFGGGASVLLRKPRADAEVYNDLDGRIVNLFRVLRDPSQAARLLELLALTPYARAEHDLSYEPIDDPVEAARRTIVRSMMGHGSRGATSTHRTGFRMAARRGFLPADDWAVYRVALGDVVRRLDRVVIEHIDARVLIARYDDPRTLHYVDPPYPHATRSTPEWGRAYAHELTDDGHRELAATLHAAQGAVVLSGYPCDLYDRELYPTWERHTVGTLADGREPRTEVVWLNAACVAARRAAQPQLRLEGE